MERSYLCSGRRCRQCMSCSHLTTSCLPRHCMFLQGMPSSCSNLHLDSSIPEGTAALAGRWTLPGMTSLPDRAIAELGRDSKSRQGTESRSCSAVDNTPPFLRTAPCRHCPGNSSPQGRADIGIPRYSTAGARIREGSKCLQDILVSDRAVCPCSARTRRPCPFCRNSLLDTELDPRCLEDSSCLQGSQGSSRHTTHLRNKNRSGTESKRCECTACL